MAKNGAHRGGRPKGKLASKTLEKLAMKKVMDQMIMAKTAPLVRAGMIEAMGMTFVYRIDDVKNPQGKVIAKKHVRVTDPDEIAMALDKMEEGGYDPDQSFYYVTTKEPSMAAVEKLLNQPFGKVKESLEVTNPDGNLKTIIVNKYGKK